MHNYRFIISGGGTGGHIYPAIAIANELKNRYPESEILFVGAKGRMEMEKVPEAGYIIEGLWISGIQRSLSFKNLAFPFKVLASLWKARNILKRFRPDVAIGTGGYASGPLLKMAELKGIPCVLQEQNSYPGITNKWLANKASKIFVAYDGLDRYFPANKIVKTGNPVRQDLLSITAKRDEAQVFFELNSNKKTLLVLGGSLGARSINKLIENKLTYFAKEGIQVIWQCGKIYRDTYAGYCNDTVHVLPFISRMDLAYAAADVIISRAGASSVSELCIVGKPVLFIPSPNVAEDHQTKNAQAIVRDGAGLMLKEAELEDKFEEVFGEMITSISLQETLSKNIKHLAKPDATKEIVDQIEVLLKRQSLV